MVVLGPGASLYFSLSFAYADPDLEPKWQKPRVVRTNRAAKACGACERSSKLGIRRVEAQRAGGGDLQEAPTRFEILRPDLCNVNALKGQSTNFHHQRAPLSTIVYRNKEALSEAPPPHTPFTSMAPPLPCSCKRSVDRQTDRRVIALMLNVNVS